MLMIVLCPKIPFEQKHIKKETSALGFSTTNFKEHSTSFRYIILITTSCG